MALASTQQVRTIARLCAMLKINEPLEERCASYEEARAIMYQLKRRLSSRGQETKGV